LAPILIAVVCSAGCERTTGPASDGGSTPVPQRSPRATVAQLIAARRSGSYQLASALVVPGRGHEVVTTLMAVDEFLHANRALCNYVRVELGPGAAQLIDHSRWGAHLDIFSRYAEVIDEQIDGDTATVAFTVDGQLPVRHAQLRLVDGAWCYDPGAGYAAELPTAFQRMARGMRLVLDDLKGGRISAEAVRADPDLLVEEVRVRLLPGVKMLPVPTSRPAGN
jgi:hypothetical protein